MQTSRKLGLLFSPESHDQLISHPAKPVKIWSTMYTACFIMDEMAAIGSMWELSISTLWGARSSADAAGPCLRMDRKAATFGSGVSIGNCYQVAGDRLILFMASVYGVALATGY
jgi:hypothetical protein